MATTASVTEASDELCDFPCTPCNKKEKNSEANAYCVDCEEYLCANCVDSHNSFSLLAGHTLVGRSKFGQNGSGCKKLPSVPTERCRLHSLKLVDMYCASHDAVGCHVCFTIMHKGCEDIHYIPEYVQTKDLTNDSKKTKAELEKAISDMELILKKKLEEMEIIRKPKQDTLKT